MIVAPLQNYVSSLAQIYCYDVLKSKIQFLNQVLKLNIEAWLMLVPNSYGFNNFFINFISFLALIPFYGVIIWELLFFNPI
jgi:hypothetical protein